jgi:hypothetical protein
MRTDKTHRKLMESRKDRTRRENPVSPYFSLNMDV